MKTSFDPADQIVWRRTASWLFVSAFVLISPASAPATEVTSILVSPAAAVDRRRPGQRLALLPEPFAHAVSQVFEPSLHGRLTSGSNSFPAVLVSTNRSGTGATIAPGGFVNLEYWFDVPATINGPAILDVSNYNRIVIQVESGAPGTPVAVQTPSAPPDTNTAPRSALMEFLGQHIYGYEPIYFVLGQYPAAEFQFSLKYKPFDIRGRLEIPLGHTYFAYNRTPFGTSSRATRRFTTPDTNHRRPFFPALYQKSGLQLTCKAASNTNPTAGAGPRSAVCTPFICNRPSAMPCRPFSNFPATSRLGLLRPGQQ